MSTDTLTSIDETNAALLSAITRAIDELNAGRCVEAGITLTMALQEHKARLVNLVKDESGDNPTHNIAYPEME